MQLVLLADLTSLSEGFSSAFGIIRTVATVLCALAIAYNGLMLFLRPSERDMGASVKAIVFCIAGIIVINLLGGIMNLGRNIGKKYVWDPTKYESDGSLDELSAAGLLANLETLNEQAASETVLELKDELDDVIGEGGTVDMTDFSEDIKNILQNSCGLEFWEDENANKAVPWSEISLRKVNESYYTLTWDSFTIIEQPLSTVMSELAERLEEKGLARYTDSELLERSNIIATQILGNLNVNSAYDTSKYNYSFKCDLSVIITVQADGRFQGSQPSGCGKYTKKLFGSWNNALHNHSGSSRNLDADEVMDLLIQAELVNIELKH